MDLVSASQVLGNLGEFLGSIAVFATLIYLSIQVKHSKLATEANTKIAQQNHSLALAQNQLARVDLITKQIRSVVLSGELAEILVKYDKDGIGSLSSAEHRRFHTWHPASTSSTHWVCWTKTVGTRPNAGSKPRLTYGISCKWTSSGARRSLKRLPEFEQLNTRQRNHRLNPRLRVARRLDESLNIVSPTASVYSAP